MEKPQGVSAPIATHPTDAETLGGDADQQGLAARAVGTLAHVVAVFRGGARASRPRGTTVKPL